MLQIVVRQMAAADLDEVHTIEKREVAIPYAMEVLTRFQSRPGTCWVAVCNQRIVGYLITRYRGHLRFRIERVVVEKHVRRRRVGTRLCSECIHHLTHLIETFSISVRLGYPSTEALHFFRSLGFGAPHKFTVENGTFLLLTFVQKSIRYGRMTFGRF